ncbi:hypothetical protein, partial [Neobacillus drentensis]|uniref:hypothetical protein n=1 Tax=Neobacillus drentensis TaxID=220684 RepID=UPI00286CF844
CIRHAASVRPEPGSNSPRKLISSFCYVGLASLLKLIIFVCLHDFVCLVFKEQFNETTLIS